MELKSSQLISYFAPAAPATLRPIEGIESFLISDIEFNTPYQRVLDFINICDELSAEKEKD